MLSIDKNCSICIILKTKIVQSYKPWIFYSKPLTIQSSDGKIYSSMEIKVAMAAVPISRYRLQA